MTNQLSIKNFTFRKLNAEELENAMQLSLNVFIKCNSSDFNEEGLDSFKSFISSKEYTKDLTLYGAYQQTSLIGVLAIKNAGTHISLFFIDKEFQGLGIGRKLFNLMLKEYNPQAITVNSSIYATDVYRKLGFETINDPVIKDGLRFVPMFMKK